MEKNIHSKFGCKFPFEKYSCSTALWVGPILLKLCKSGKSLKGKGQMKVFCCYHITDVWKSPPVWLIWSKHNRAQEIEDLHILPKFHIEIGTYMFGLRSADKVLCFRKNQYLEKKCNSREAILDYNSASPSKSKYKPSWVYHWF